MSKKSLRLLTLGLVIVGLIGAGCISQAQVGSHSCNVVTYDVVVQSMEFDVELTFNSEPVPQEELPPAYVIVTVAHPVTGEALAARAHPIPSDGEEQTISGSITLDTIPDGGKVAVGIKFQGSGEEASSFSAEDQPADEPEEFLQVVALSCDPPLQVEFPGEWTYGVKELGYGPDHPLYRVPNQSGLRACGFFDVLGHGPKQVSLADYPACAGAEVEVYCLNGHGEWVNDTVTGQQQVGDQVSFTSGQHGGCGLFPASGSFISGGTEPGLYDGGDGLITNNLGTLAIGGSASGTLASVFEADNYIFDGQVGQSVTISVTGQGDADPRVVLIDPDGTVIGEDDDGGGGFNSLLAVTLPSTGTFTVRVDVFTPGSYTVSIR